MDNLEKILNRPEFSALTVKQKELLLRAVMECRDVDQTRTIAAFMKYIPMLESERRLTSEEKRGIIDCILGNLSGSERKNAEEILKAARSFGFNF